jgi:predicted nucleotidyltransferase
MQFDPRLHATVAAQPYPLVFATVSGAHLYGFASPDSDYDLRGVHVLPPRAVLGLDTRDESIERSSVVEGLELDLVTHDARKFFLLLLKKNGYVLEQLLSPLVVKTSPEHEELKALMARCLTRYHVYHYLGFAQTQWRLFEKEEPHRAKPLLYVYRVLLTGIHLMRSGEVEANLLNLNREFRLPYVDELVARKRAGGEHSTLSEVDVAFREREYLRLRRLLEEAGEKSRLGEAPTAKPGLDDLLLRLRGV